MNELLDLRIRGRPNVRPNGLQRRIDHLRRDLGRRYFGRTDLGRRTLGRYRRREVLADDRAVGLGDLRNVYKDFTNETIATPHTPTNSI